MSDMENTGDQHENSVGGPLELLKEAEAKRRAEWLRPYQYKKGQSGNPSGRPAGISLKEYAKMKLNSMSDEEREEFLNGLSKDTIWEMAEGKAKQDTNITGNLTISEVLDNLENDGQPPKE